MKRAGPAESPAPNPGAKPYVRLRAGGPYWYAKWSRNGKPVIRALGRAWAEPDGAGGWIMKRGRPRDGELTQAQAAETMLRFVRAHHAEQTLLETDAEERRRRGSKFREVAHAYLAWMKDVKGAKPSTLRNHRSLLAEPGEPYRRGRGATEGRIMAALGDRPASAITTRDVERLLTSVATSGVSPATVNRTRSAVSAIFTYGMRPSTFGLPSNPVKHADRRAEPQIGQLAFYSPQEVETLAMALAAGAHRDRDRVAVTPEEIEARAADDRQDGEVIRIAAFAGLRRGELIALKWRDVDLVARKLIVRRSVSDTEELASTKTRHSREVPVPDQAKAAFERLRRRGDFTAPDDYVFVNRFGRRLDPSALRRRYERARNRSGLEPLRFHDLRHTYGSLLVAGGVDLVSVKAAMGHARISTTERYLHARPATDQADRFTRALSGANPATTERPRARRNRTSRKRNRQGEARQALELSGGDLARS